MKILTIIGARPQFIKAATISREILKREGVEEVIVHTGQHFDENMSDIFFTEMDIPKPNHHLHISSLSHGAMTGRMIEGIEKILIAEKPDWVLVYGDTNSTLAGALAASKLHINIAHIEAGLRSFNMRMPEEQNRILTDKLSSLLFSPTSSGIENLKSEGFDVLSQQVHKSGDVMYDAALFYKEKAKAPVQINPDIMSKPFVLATIHRAENTDDLSRLTEIVSALNEISKQVPVILPMHPRTKNILKEHNIELNCLVIDPIGYLEMVYLLDRCQFVASDSGGVQKEAYFFHKQCLILRDETEWMELVEHGTNVIVGANKEKILNAYENLSSALDFKQEFYGNGQAASSILDTIIDTQFSIFA